MVDFFKVATRSPKRGIFEIYPKFIIVKSEDLMIRGGDFYAIWLEDVGLWSTNEIDALKMIDHELDEYRDKNIDMFGDNKVIVQHMRDSESGMIDKWHKYCQKQMRDNYHDLDTNLVFSNTKVKKTDYASRKLPYPLEETPIDAYDELMSVLYSDDERRKIEWAIGAIISGDSQKIQKFLVLYGAAGTGKSTVLNIVQDLFEGYYSVFDAKALGSSNNAFALESFKNNPLVAIQHDGDLSHIEDNTRLNSLVSHEIMTVNNKFERLYSTKFRSFLFMGTNKPVRITDSKSGLLRRLIDVTPTGEKVSRQDYKRLTSKVKFELSGIATHCLKVYKENKDLYDDYIPINMLGATNDFYDFVLESYTEFSSDEGVTLKKAWDMYGDYCKRCLVNFPISHRIFKEELKSYFYEFYDRYTLDDGTRVRSFYYGFRKDRFDPESERRNVKPTRKPVEIEFKEQPSIFDEMYADCPAQLAKTDGTPMRNWDHVRTTLQAIDTSRLHYVRPPENHIVIDFDLKDETGEKSLERNMQEASKWPVTYAELSKSGAGIHLHYIYNGDVTMLSRIYDENIEIKIFNGRSSLRRKLTKCNSEPIATISSGLPTKGEKVVNFETMKSENGLRNLIIRNLNKEIHPSTKPSVDFIKKILDEAYESGMSYDVSDMKSSIIAFAASSTNQSDACLKMVAQMNFKSDDIAEASRNDDANLVFYDIEVFPNLLLVCYKMQGNDKINRMFNPDPDELEELARFRLVGFNCRRYDNHIIYARMQGYSIEQCYDLSQRIIVKKDKNAFLGGAYNLSYTDILDFASDKKSLKKLEIEMGIHHQELGMPWDQPADEKYWEKIADYCDNDVRATEAAFDYLQSDWIARQILADIAGGTVNDTTNTLTTRLIFGRERHPQKDFNYRNMGEITEKTVNVNSIKTETGSYELDPKFTLFDGNKPVFPGYKFDNGKSTYRGEETGEGGYVYAEPGIHVNVALLDINSMHPNSAVDEDLFGPWTENYEMLLDARLAVKHKDWDTVNYMFDGKLKKYVQRVIDGELSHKDLAKALKIAINSVYGLTKAGFDNPFRDPRNIDNIVAKRGGLFMINLKHEVQNLGYTVAHIKTDSIKIPNADKKIIDFVMSYGKLYGYTFEHEATYDRMCLVNDAVYVAKYATMEDCQNRYGYIPSDIDEKHEGQWTATGTQFKVPYVFKTLFSKESLEFEDRCNVFEVKTGDLYLDMNEPLPDVSDAEKQLEKLYSDFKKGKISDTEFQKNLPGLEKEVAKGHSYVFVGRVGEFCPMRPGAGSGVLYRKANNKYYAATGTTGYRWMESEMVRQLEKEAFIDESYYISLVDKAVDAINKYGNFEAFVSEDPYWDFMNIPEDAPDKIPFK